jgi:hypothetical protein
MAFIALGMGAGGLAQGGGDTWWGVLCLLAVPFFVFVLWREWRAARE